LPSHEPLQAAVNAYEPDERNRLLEAFRGQRAELKRLLQSYRIGPPEAEELLEMVMLEVLPRLPSSDVQSLEEWFFTLTLQQCIKRGQR
jgi:DNA-directed RNA polymerase specialized sigma24 family protein